MELTPGFNSGYTCHNICIPSSGILEGNAQLAFQLMKLSRRDCRSHGRRILFCSVRSQNHILDISEGKVYNAHIR